MGRKGINLSSVLICALMLGLILEQVQVEAKKKGKSCCKSTAARNCYNICRFELSQTICAKTCGCKIVPGITSRDQCPNGYKNLNFIPDLIDDDEPDSNEFCRLGCRSSVCNYMNSVDGIEGTKTIMERCGEGCDRFCNDGANIASVAA